MSPTQLDDDSKMPVTLHAEPPNLGGCYDLVQRIKDIV